MEENKKQQKKQTDRQSWNPHPAVKILYSVWMVLFSLLKLVVGALATVACIVVVCMFVFVGLLGDYLENEVIPNSDFALENYDMDLTSYLYYVDQDGNIQQLQRVYTDTNRQWASYEELPQCLIDATVAIEDKRFYEHQGVDWVTTVKACAGMFLGTGDAGGSTITQQLVKNLTTDNSITVQRKVMEWFRAASFESYYEKDVIMEWYLNTIYLGDGCYGVRSAAANYFGKEIQMLTPAEAASLIAITNNPSLFGPYMNTLTYKGEVRTAPERNRMRQEVILLEMFNQGMLTEDEYELAMDQEMVFKSGISDDDRYVECVNEACTYAGIRMTYEPGEEGQYFCPMCGSDVPMETDASQAVYSWFVETALEDVARDLAIKNGETEWNDELEAVYMEQIRRGGYHIYTTLDMKVQEQVDKIYQNLDEIPDTRSAQQLQSAIVVNDNRTGDIVAIAGGVGDNKGFDDYNRAAQARLQTGSSMKPLAIYAPAFEMGIITPATVIKDLPLHYNSGTNFPKNDNRKYSGSRTIYLGVASSVNAVAVNTLDMLGTTASYNFAKEKFRLHGLTDHYVRESDGFVMSDIDYSPLGMGALTLGVTVRDMSTAFTTFASDGVWREGRTYTKVYDSDGNLVLDNVQESEQILSEKTVNYMNYCLNRAVTNGTGGNARFSGTMICGKTGTTSSNKDRWFCGFTGYYTAAVWCGYDWPEQIYLYQSQNPAAVLWRKVMQPLHEGKSNVNLYSTSKMTSVSVCLDSGLSAGPACSLDVRDIGRTSEAMVYREDRPEGTCDKHVLVDYCVTGDGVANEYCQRFAQAGLAEIQERALVKLTQEEVDELKKASTCGLGSEYTEDRYVYLINENGTDAIFHGFRGDANKGINEPYIVCTVHTKAAWDEHQHSGGTGGEGSEGEGEDNGSWWPW